MEKTINIFKKRKQVVSSTPLALLTIYLIINHQVISILASPITDTSTSLDQVSKVQSAINVTANLTESFGSKGSNEPTLTPEEDSNFVANQSFFEILAGIQEPKVSFAFDIISRILIFLYCCLVIAYLCDEYFVPSLEHIGKALDWPRDLIGAILIPLGTSGPEIFSSAVGVFFTENDIGTGAILGSAVFNMLAIPAASGMAVAYFIGSDIRLEEVPILRDLVFYIISIIVLILVIKDNSVDLLDASLMMIMFVIYIGVMIYNAKYSKKVCQKNEVDIQAKLKTHEQRDLACLHLKSNNQTSGYQITNWNLQTRIKDINNNEKDIYNKKIQRLNLLRYQQLINEPISKEFGYVDMNNTYDGYLLDDTPKIDYLDSLVEKKQQLDLIRNKSDYQQIGDNVDDNGVGFTDNIILRWLLMPCILIFSLTMPSRFQFLIFFISIAWLSTFSYITVWSINGLSELLAIPSAISGLTILSAGSAIPDLVTSVIVIKKTGTASMSICAAIASNIFAILLGLGLPWGIQFIINWNHSGTYSRSVILLESSALPYITIILLAAIFALYLTFTICDWRLSKKFALICLAIHILFITSCCSLEILPKYLWR